MTTAKHLFRLSLLGMAALSICPAISIQPPQVYSWSGLCTDCIGTATATLTLASNYVPGNPLNGADLISFVYDPTNLITAGFSILPGNLTGIFGTIPSSLPAAANFAISSNTDAFSTQAPGNWCAGNSCNSDYGTQSSFASAPVPEPSTFVLIGTGLGVAALTRRRVSAGA